MKILYLLPYSPAKPTFGGSLRIYHILDHLCQHHDVTVAGFSTPEEEKLLIDRFPVLARKTYLVNPPGKTRSRFLTQLRSLFSSHSFWYLSTRSKELQKVIDQILSKQEFDIIQSEFPALAMYRLNSKAVKIIDAHNVEYDNFKRMAKVGNPLKKLFYHLESYKFYREETRVCRKLDGLLVTSERDISVFEKSVPGVPKFLIPNGVDANYFYPKKVKSKPHSLVFVGMMKYVPNYDGINFFLDEIFPKILTVYPDATITIIGKNPPKSITKRANRNIIVTGFVEDTRPYIQESSVYVVPLRMGGGTRLKVIEALAMKIPLVTTSIGCEGIDISHGESALIADDPQEFANAVMKLFIDKELCDSLTENGYKIVIDKYRWKSIGRHLDEAYEKLTGLKIDTSSKSMERWSYDTNGIYQH